MDYLIDFVLHMFLDIGLSTLVNKKTNVWIKIPIFIVYSIILSFIPLLLLSFIMSLYQSSNYIVSIILVLLALVYIYFVQRSIRNEVKELDEKLNKDV